MSKKIQIRSFIKGGNHGQYLQALGLKALIESISKDFEVSHLDYENHFAKELKAQVKSGHPLKFIFMRNFWREFIEFTKISEAFDLSVYGSDMIWHLESPLFPADPVFFGKHDDAKYKISYAPSVGSRGSSEPAWVGEYLKNFNALGVRDYNTQNFVYDNSGLKAELVIDPCFHLLNSRYLDLPSRRLNKIAVYSPMTDTLVDAFNSVLKAGEIEESFNYSGYFPRKRFFKDFYKQVKKPLEVVGEIAEAKFLLTSTFHGVMMALMTRTPFLAINNPNLAARLDSPIAKVFAPGRLIEFEEISNLSSKDLSTLYSDDDLDWDELDRYIQSSRDWMAEQMEIIYED